MTKLQITLAAAVLTAGMIGLIIQQHSLSALQRSTAAAQHRIAQLESENARSTTLQRESEAEIAKLRAQIATLTKLSASATPRPPAAGARTAAAPIAAILAPLPDTAEIRKMKADRYHRYGPFFRQRGLTPAQSERFVELMIHQMNAREDLQASVRAAQLRGDAPGVEELRSQLYAPIRHEMREMLGEEGYAAYSQYETSSFYRVAFIEPMLPMFTSAGLSLTEAQTEQLVQIISANKQLTRADPTDIGSKIQIDWDSVVAMSTSHLAPPQLAILQSYAQRKKGSK